jgi:hypothetical protein
MKLQRRFTTWGSLLLLAGATQATEPRSEKHVCAGANPRAICTPANTCGSASSPCAIDIKRGADSASVTPGVPGARPNTPFCVRAGVTIVWQSSSRNTGFTVDFGPFSPFEREGAIIGGSDRSVSLTAKKEGCYRFSLGACNPGAIYGMCAEGKAEIVIIPAGN